MKTTVAALLGILLTTSAYAAPITLDVLGTSDMWLAGAAPGTTASGAPPPTPPPGVDTAPFQSPALVPSSFAIIGESLLKFEATGGVFNFDNGCISNPLFTVAPCDGPDGGALTPHFAGAENGISNINAPVNSLLGVFLDNSVPSGAAPPMLDFATGSGTNFSFLAPLLRQVFFIGDGNDAGGVDQQFFVPLGATRLFLGTMDGFQWSNNKGLFRVTIDTISDNEPEPPFTPVPEPATLTLLGVGLVARRLMKKKARA